MDNNINNNSLNNGLNLYGSICLSDIPKELIVQGGNGKLYLNIEVRPRRSPSAYGNTHYVKATCRVQDRRQGVNYFIGDLRPSGGGYGGGAGAQQAEDAPQSPGYTRLPPISQQQPTPQQSAKMRVQKLRQDLGLPF